MFKLIEPKQMRCKIWRPGPFLIYFNGYNKNINKDIVKNIRELSLKYGYIDVSEIDWEKYVEYEEDVDKEFIKNVIVYFYGNIEICVKYPNYQKLCEIFEKCKDFYNKIMIIRTEKKMNKNQKNSDNNSGKQHMNKYRYLSSEQKDRKVKRTRLSRHKNRILKKKQNYEILSKCKNENDTVSLCKNQNSEYKSKIDFLNVMNFKNIHINKINKNIRVKRNSQIKCNYSKEKIKSHNSEKRNNIKVITENTKNTSKNINKIIFNNIKSQYIKNKIIRTEKSKTNVKNNIQKYDNSEIKTPVILQNPHNFKFINTNYTKSFECEYIANYDNPIDLSFKNKNYKNQDMESIENDKNIK